MQGIIGPEFVLYFAVGQRYEAKQSVIAFRRVGYDSWTLTHAFYANMGGFVLHPRHGKSFPITARQLLYLVKNKFVEYPSLKRKVIQDQSKADWFAKGITCLQICWLVLQLSARLSQKLQITTLELTTMTYVICAIGCYTQWAHKPLDVGTSTHISSQYTLNEMLAPRTVPLSGQLNPFDFIDNGSPSWSFNVQPYLGFRFQKHSFPARRFANDRFPMIGCGREAVGYLLLSIVFAAIHLFGWNFAFNSRIEQILWRAAGISIAGTMVCLWAAEGSQEMNRWGRWRQWRAILMRDPIPALRSREEAMMAADFVPRWEFWVLVPVTTVYFASRAYVLVEMFAGLRGQPLSVYESVDWLKFVPCV